MCALAEEEGQSLASSAAFGNAAPGLPIVYQPERFNRVLAMIDARFAETLTLDQLAGAGNMSVRSLNRYFQQHVERRRAVQADRSRQQASAANEADCALIPHPFDHRR